MEPTSKYSRRRFLILGGLSALGIVAEACARAAEGVTGQTPGPGINASQATAAPTLAGVGAGKGAPPQTPSVPGQVMITANADFYTVAYNGERIDAPADWKLAVGGNVDKPLTLTLDDIKQMPSVEEMRTLECISNPAGGPLISNAVWKGIKLRDLLDRSGVRANTIEIKLESFDGYSTAIPLDLAVHDHSLLVYEMNGDALPVEHGKPLRCLFPGRYGMKQPKWLSKITALTSKYQGYWESQGWSDQALVKPNSRIDSPGDSEKIKPPTLEMKGIGFSDDSGISTIELSWDNGKTWVPATLVRGPSAYVWTNWSWSGPTPPEGQYSLVARVTDNSGQTQNEASFSLLGDTFPNGTSALSPVIVNVVKA